MFYIYIFCSPFILQIWFAFMTLLSKPALSFCVLHDVSPECSCNVELKHLEVIHI
jgi:hypothetical protein